MGETREHNQDVYSTNIYPSVVSFYPCLGLKVFLLMKTKSLSGVISITLSWEILGYIDLLIHLTQRKKKYFYIFTARASIIWSKTSTERGSYLTQSLGDSGTIFLGDYISKRWLPGSWVKLSYDIKLVKGFLKDLHLKGEEKEISITSFLK